MELHSKPGKLIAVVFQVGPTLPQVFLRYGFGRRAFGFGNAIGLLLDIGIAAALRSYVPHFIIYAPLRVIPPFNWMPGSETLWTSNEAGMPQSELIAFATLAALSFLLACTHSVRLLIARRRGTDRLNTQFWGESLLAKIPLTSGFSPRALHRFIEPGLFIVVGYLLCAFVPLFGMYLMAAGLVLGFEARLPYKVVKEEELDARDSLAESGRQKGIHAEAQDHATRAEQSRTAAVSEKTLARVQKNPHALLALDPDETVAVRNELGSEQFGDLVDQLEPDAQQEIYRRVAMGFRVPQARPA